MIDTLHVVETPEGVDLNLRAAGPVARAFAYAVDLFLLAVLMLAAGLTLTPLGALGEGGFLILAFSLNWFLPVVFEVYVNGQTPGKRMMGLRVVERDGTPVSGAASLVRNLLRTVDFLPMLWLAGLACMVLDRSFRRLGDLAAGTLVVYAVPIEAGVRAPFSGSPLRPPLELEADEERAVIAFAERAPLLSTERALELAAIAEPLMDGDDPRDRLERMAAWLTGRYR